MTTDPDHHSGLRPLSPYGEGYCRWCYFVVGLTYDGQLVEHQRGVTAYGQAKTCPGSLTRPPKVTPYSSRKAAFRLSSPDVWCPGCEKPVRSTRWGGTLVYADHSQLLDRRLPGCRYSMRAIDPRHRGEQAG